MGHGRIFLSFLIFLLPTAVLANNVVQRPLEDAFVDTFFLENVEPIGAQMPSNWGDPETNLLAGVRIDNLDALVESSPFATFDDMLLGFYDNQQEFNEDPTRNRIVMHGTVEEVVERDGTVVAKIDITYENLPLTVYTADSFDEALNELDLARLVIVVENGTMVGHFAVEMELPFAGAPLHYWDAVFAGAIRRQSFIGHGSGWLVDSGGTPQQVQVQVVQFERDGEFTRETVRVIPLSGD